MLPYAALFASALVASYLLAFPVRAAALRLGVVDQPEKRKMHQVPIPLLGGVAIFLSFAAVSIPTVLSGATALTAESLRPFMGLMAGGALIVLLGIYDDVKGANALLKFTVQSIAALIVISQGVSVDMFTNPLGASVNLGWLGIPVALIWLVGVTNAVNLIDGLDGLAIGIGTIASIGLFAIALTQSVFVATLACILAGAACGFLGHNFYPAKQFLGDSGSMFIGFALAVLGLQGSFKASTATVLILPIIVLGIPIFDTLFAIFRRARRRANPFKADREHIHHRLVRIGLHHRSVVLVMYFLCAYLALTAYSIAQFPSQTSLLFMVLLSIGGIIGLRTLRFIEERLESALEAARSGTISRPISGSRGSRTADRKAATLPTGGRFSALVCEVDGFGEAGASAAVRDAVCEDIRSMLSRRMKVHGVVAEISGPGRLVLIVRTEPLTTALKALVKDGLSWYFSDHRETLGSSGHFPQIEWLGERVTESEDSSRGAGAPRGTPVNVGPRRRAGAART